VGEAGQDRTGTQSSARLSALEILLRSINCIVTRKPLELLISVRSVTLLLISREKPSWGSALQRTALFTALRGCVGTDHRRYLLGEALVREAA
jgi:hypothetical protein